MRSADPWTDTAVIDARAPRTNQTIVGTLSLLAFVTGWWPILGLLAAQLAIGLTFGRRWCLPCLFYFDVIQPRFGEGPIEDSRPPRFANWSFPLPRHATLGARTRPRDRRMGLGLIVAALAAACRDHRLCVDARSTAWARASAGSVRTIERVDLAGSAPRAGGASSSCISRIRSHRLPHLERSSGRWRDVFTVDVSRRPELARKYGVALVPTAVAVGPGGIVTARIA